MGPEQDARQHVEPTEQPTMQASEGLTIDARITQVVDGAIAHKMRTTNAVWSPEAVETLRNYLIPELAHVAYEANGQLNSLNTLVGPYGMTANGRPSTALIVSLHGRELATIITPSGLPTTNRSQRSSAGLLTRTIFRGALKYLQNGVTCEEELKAKNSRTGIFAGSRSTSNRSVSSLYKR